MSSPLAQLLFKEYRRKVLGLLLLQPGESYHVREIARLTGTVPGTLHKELSKLAGAGILEKISRGNQVSYQANRDCPVYEELASIFRKTSGLADVLIGALAPLADNIDIALIFGSMAGGKAGAHSDIDLLVVGRLDYGDLVKMLYPVQEQLGREINPKLYAPEEWKTARKQNSAFIQDVLGKPVIELMGNKDDPGKSGRENT